MPVEVLTRSEVPAPVFPPRKRWTRTDCESLEASGLWERERLELVDGELISRMGKKRPHVIVLILVQQWLTSAFGAACVNPEAPIDVSPDDNPTNEPEPDLLVLAQPAWIYTANPKPADVRLLVEISDTTLSFDMGTKARLYARAGIAEYWVVDVAGRRVLVHREPRAGAYGSIKAYREGESIVPLAAPDQRFRVENAFPEQPASA